MDNWPQQVVSWLDAGDEDDEEDEDNDDVTGTQGSQQDTDDEKTNLDIGDATFQLPSGTQ